MAIGQLLAFGPQAGSMGPAAPAAPAAPPEDNVGGWSRFIETLRTDPAAKMALLQMSARLMQTPQPGQNWLGHIGQGVEAGVNTLAIQRELQRRQQTQQQELAQRDRLAQQELSLRREDMTGRRRDAQYAREDASARAGEALESADRRAELNRQAQIEVAKIYASRTGAAGTAAARVQELDAIGQIILDANPDIRKQAEAQGLDPMAIAKWKALELTSNLRPGGGMTAQEFAAKAVMQLTPNYAWDPDNVDAQAQKLQDIFLGVGRSLGLPEQDASRVQAATGLGGPAIDMPELAPGSAETAQPGDRARIQFPDGGSALVRVGKVENGVVTFIDDKGNVVIEEPLESVQRNPNVFVFERRR